MLSLKHSKTKRTGSKMALIAHVGYGFKVKINDIKVSLLDLLPQEDVENWLDYEEMEYKEETGAYPDDAFFNFQTYDYIELIDEIAKQHFPGIFATLPGWSEADHDEICIVLKETYGSAYGNANFLNTDTLTEEDEKRIREFSRKYFDEAPMGWLFWPYYG